MSPTDHRRIVAGPPRPDSGARLTVQEWARLTTQEQQFLTYARQLDPDQRRALLAFMVANRGAGKWSAG